MQVKLADNSVKDILGNTDLLKIKIGSSETYLELIIIDLEDNEVLLGLDWFIATCVAMSSADMKIYFPRLNIPAHTQN